MKFTKSSVNPPSLVSLGRLKRCCGQMADGSWSWLFGYNLLAFPLGEGRRSFSIFTPFHRPSQVVSNVEVMYNQCCMVLFLALL